MNPRMQRNPLYRVNALLVSSLTIIIWLACSCGNGQVNLKVLRVFDGFSYVGSGSVPERVDPQVSFPAHGDFELPLPEKLNAGEQYIFHHRRPVDDEDLALNVLPARLRELGFTLISVPSSSTGLIRTYYGGPIFRIQFREGKHTFLVFNRNCPKLMSEEKGGGQWIEEDYVLAILSKEK